MTDADRAYLAGLVDGEGAVYIVHRKASRAEKSDRYAVEFAVAMTDKPSIQRLARAFGGRVAGPYQRFGRSGFKYRPVWRWRVSNGVAVRVLELLLPFLRVKRRVAVEAIKLHKLARQPGGRTISRREQRKRETLYRRVWKLNNPVQQVA